MMVQPGTSPAVSADLIYTDDLTGLRNRRFLYQLFGQGWSEVTGSDEELSLAIVDLDYFKQVNDIHGHLTGDLVLSETALLIQDHLAGEDHAIRYGGDEFVLLLPGRSKFRCRELMERLRSAMADKEFVSKEENQPLEVMLSFSIGVATYPDDGSSGEQLMAAADKALYASKKAGRNCVTVAGELPDELEDEIDQFRTFPSKSLVGRQDLIETLAGQCELLTLGNGSWTALSGPAGIGKSRLLQEALRSGLDAGLCCSVVHLSEDEATQPYAAIARLLLEVGARYPKILSRVVHESPPELTAFLEVHAADGILSIGAVEEAMPAPSPQTLRQTLLQAFQGLCAYNEWLLLLDDVGYLDPHSGELLQAVVESEGLPVGVVSAHRVADRRAPVPPGIVFLETLEPKPWFDQRRVEPLPPDAVEVLISVLLPNLHAPADFVSHVFEITGGNPLFVEELLRIGIARQTVTRRGGEWFVQVVDRRNLPPTLEEAIAQRMSTLDSEIGTGLSRAAALGTSITPELLRDLLGKNEGEILDFLDKAREQGIVSGGLEGDLSEVRFASSTIRQQAYERMSHEDRARAHRQIGKIAEHRAGSLVGALASRLAYHFERGEVYEKAKAYLEAAARTAPPIVVAGTWTEAEVPTHRRRRITEAAIPLAEETWPIFDVALRALVQAFKSFRMYPQGSPVVDTAIEELHEQLARALEHAEVISLAAVEDTLVVNGVPYPIRKQPTLVRGLLDQLVTRGIRGLTLRRGMTQDETFFLVSQLGSPGQIERDPDAWEELLDREGIDNVDFGDRVYVPAEGVANAPVSADGRLSRSGIVRVASNAELDELTEESGRDEPVEALGPESDPEAPPLSLSTAEVKKLIGRLQADASIDEEIQTLVPLVADLLRRLLLSVDEQSRGQHSELMRAVGLATPVGEGPAPTAAGDPDWLQQIREEGMSDDPQSLLSPAERRFEALIEVRDFEGAAQVLGFLRRCQGLDTGDGELTRESQRSLTRIATGGAVQLLLEDLLDRSERPDHDALVLLRELGQEGGQALVTFLQETDDLRARRAVARLLKQIGGETQRKALESITHGDNPVVARRVIAVLDYLSDGLPTDLARAVAVRNPALLGESIKVLQRQPRSIQMQVFGTLLNSASPELVCRGTYYLSEWNFREASGMLLMLLRESEDYEVLTAVSAALARWRLNEAVPILGEMLGRKQVMRIVPVFPRALRREFARALATIDTPESRAQLSEFVRDMDPEIRNIARGLPAPTGA